MKSKCSLIFYRDTCQKCRLLSQWVAILSLGTIERIPISSPRAEHLREYPQFKDKLIFQSNAGYVTGWKVVPAAIRSALQYLFS